MTDMTRALRHLAWTNDKLFTELAALPPEALDACYAPDAWPVGQLAVHIVGGAEWYCYSLGHADHRLFTTVFLTSGAVFVALVFVAGAVGTAELSAWQAGQDMSSTERLIPGVTVNELLVNYTSRMAAVFCLAISTFGRLRKLLPAWLTILGSLTGLFLLLVPFGVQRVEFVFPAWIAVLSVYLFIVDPGGKSLGASPERTG